jgi:hypothetical protein
MESIRFHRAVDFRHTVDFLMEWMLSRIGCHHAVVFVT